MCQRLLARNKYLERELFKQRKRVKINSEIRIRNILNSIFTPGQIKLLLNPKKKKIHWSSEDIAAAISLRSVSPKAYRYLQKARNVPLPALSTLRRWVSTFNVDNGILEHVFLIMKHKSQNMTNMDKISTLCFDEIHLSNQAAIERREEKVIGPHEKCQVAVAKGLFAKWKQPVYYEFDQSMTKNILTTIIAKLYEIGYTVVAITSDLGSTNQRLLNELDIDSKEGKTYFLHPCDEKIKIYVFIDVPHLIKLLRNNLFDSGFFINGHYINKTCLEKLIQINGNDLKIVHKLSRFHLDVKGTQRQNVKLAAQVFSNTNATALEWCGKKGFIKDCLEWSETAKFLKLFNDWFDLFNSSNKFGSHSGIHAYGINTEKQNELLAEVSLLVKDMRVGKKNNLLPFQKGILINNESLKNLYNDIKIMFENNQYPVTYIMTTRLNQDVVENLFAYIRAMGACNDRPTAFDLRYRFRWYILGKHSTDIFTEGSNTIVQNLADDETCLTSMSDELSNSNEENAENNQLDYETIQEIQFCNISEEFTEYQTNKDIDLEEFE